VERIGTDDSGIAWRVEGGERLVDLRQKRGIFVQKSLKNGQKVGKKRPFLRAFERDFIAVSYSFCDGYRHISG
jgi:hypothetical protein